MNGSLFLGIGRFVKGIWDYFKPLPIPLFVIYEPTYDTHITYDYDNTLCGVSIIGDIDLWAKDDYTGEQYVCGKCVDLLPPDIIKLYKGGNLGDITGRAKKIRDFIIE